MSDHILTLTKDDDGWDVAECSCGSVSPPCPDTEIAASFFTDHFIAVTQLDDDGAGGIAGAAEREEQLTAERDDARAENVRLAGLLDDCRTALAGMCSEVTTCGHISRDTLDLAQRLSGGVVDRGGSDHKDTGQ